MVLAGHHGHRILNRLCSRSLFHGNSSDSSDVSASLRAPLIGMEAEEQDAELEPMIVPKLLQAEDCPRKLTNGYLERIDPVPPSETN